MDSTEAIRREMVGEINSKDNDRLKLEKEYGQVWNTDELSKDFEVTGFMDPFVCVKRKSDGKVGTLMFSHSPRFYFKFE